jgi:hypothetical protein
MMSRERGRRGVRRQSLLPRHAALPHLSISNCANSRCFSSALRKASTKAERAPSTAVACRPESRISLPSSAPGTFLLSMNSRQSSLEENSLHRTFRIIERALWSLQAMKPAESASSLSVLHEQVLNMPESGVEQCWLGWVV